MQEFRIQTSSFAPEFGRTPGGQISVVTRSGTNSFHGTLFEYFRNDVLDAKDWFVNFNRLLKPAERQNDFGGVFSGPVVKDKTFFFFSYEGLRLRQPATQETVVPDNTSRQQAPASMQPFLNAYPVANGPQVGTGLAQFNSGYSNPSSLDAYSMRFDHILNSRMSLFGRYNYSPSDSSQRGPPPLHRSSSQPVGAALVFRANTNHRLHWRRYSTSQQRSARELQQSQNWNSIRYGQFWRCGAAVRFAVVSERVLVREWFFRVRHCQHRDLRSGQVRDE